MGSPSKRRYDGLLREGGKEKEGGKGKRMIDLADKAVGKHRAEVLCAERKSGYVVCRGEE